MQELVRVCAQARARSATNSARRFYYTGSCPYDHGGHSTAKWPIIVGTVVGGLILIFVVCTALSRTYRQHVDRTDGRLLLSLASEGLPAHPRGPRASQGANPRVTARPPMGEYAGAGAGARHGAGGAARLPYGPEGRAALAGADNAHARHGGRQASQPQASWPICRAFFGRCTQLTHAARSAADMPVVAGYQADDDADFKRPDQVGSGGPTQADLRARARSRAAAARPIRTMRRSPRRCVRGTACARSTRVARTHAQVVPNERSEEGLPPDWVPQDPEVGEKG
jgi:hypothetical protein